MKISVLTPSFNSGQYLLRAIESVLAQDYKDWEHIVIDGGSQDGTTEILKKYPHLIWESSPDKGQSDAMNKAFARSTGDVIVYLNADDEIENGFFSTLVVQLKLHKTVDMMVVNLRVNKLGKVYMRKPSISLFTILQFPPARFPLNPVSYAYRKTLQEKIGSFPIGNHYSMDYWFLVRAYLLGKILKYECIGGTFHLDGSNKSVNVDRSRQQIIEVRNDFLKAYFYKPRVAFFILTIPFQQASSSIQKFFRRLSKFIRARITK